MPGRRGRALRIAALLCLTCCAGLLCLEVYYRHLNGSARATTASGQGQAVEAPLCVRRILADFGAPVDLLQTAATSNRSAPVYISPPQPIPISAACGRLFANWTASPQANVSEMNVVSKDKQQSLPQILHQIVTNFTQRNLEIYMTDGSLLGSVRHFNYFPWDADIDVMILVSQMPQVRQLLIELSAGDEFHFRDSLASEHWQMGILCEANHSRPLKRLYGGHRLYPEKSCHTNVDFFLTRVEAGHRMRPEVPHSTPIADVYPLRLMPYGPYLIPGPNRPDNVLAATYGGSYLSKCKFKYLLTPTVDCSSLHSRYPFVARIASQQLGRIKVLVYNATLLALYIPSQVQ